MRNEPKNRSVWSGLLTQTKDLTPKTPLIMSGSRNPTSEIRNPTSYRPKMIFSLENNRVVIHRKTSANPAAQTAATT
jgi:hypothetical protein